MLLSKLRFLLVGVVLAPPCLLPWEVQVGDATVSAHQDDSSAASPEAMSALFDAAAAEFSVPADLLRAYATVRAQDAARVFGPMGLREGEGAENEVARGAALLGVSSDAVKNDARTNVRAGAALLRAQRTSVSG